MRLPQIASRFLLAIALLSALPTTVPLTSSRASAQLTISDSTKTQVEQLFKQGGQLHQASQLTEALIVYQQALNLCQQTGDRPWESLILTSIGLVYDRLGQRAKALQFHYSALKIAQEVQDQSLEGTALNHIGSIYRNLGQWAKALEFHQQALKIAQELRDRKGESHTLFYIGVTYDLSGQYARALQFHQQGLKIAQEVRDRVVEGYTFKGLGSIYGSLGQYGKALQSHQQALKIWQEIGDRGGEGQAFNSLGSIYGSLGQYGKALQSYQQALNIAQEVRDRGGEGQAFLGVGGAYLNLGEYARALESYQQALKIWQEIGDRPSQSTTLDSLGVIYVKLGQYTNAMLIYQQALKLNQAMGDRVGEGRMLSAIGSVYDLLGQPANVLKHRQQALNIYQTVGSLLAANLELRQIGRTYERLGQPVKAREFYQQALKSYRDMPNQVRESDTLIDIGITYRDSEPEKALEFYRQALKIRQTLGDRLGESNALEYIGEIYSIAEQHADALTYYQQALKIHQITGNRDNESNVLIQIGQNYTSLRQYADAMQSYQQALRWYQAAGNRVGEREVLTAIGRHYQSLRQYAKALEYHQQALKITQSLGQREMEAHLLTTVGLAFINSEKYTAAEQALYQSVLVFEQLRPGLSNKDKITFNNTQKTPYAALQMALAAQNKIEAALEVSERSRTRAFVELLATRLASNSAQSHMLQRLNQPISLAEIQQVARQQNATLVEYSVIGKNLLYIWLIHPTGQIEFRKTQYQSTSAQLQELVSITRGALQRGVPRSGTASTSASQPTNVRLDQFGAYQLRTLHQLLIEPIADLLPKNPNDHVIFIPQNELLLVPFPALMDEKGNYLIEQHTLLTAPSIQVLSLTDQNQQHLNRTPNRTALVVGNPALPKLSEGSLVPLPAAEQEARTVAQLLKTTPMIGAAANKSAVLNQMPQARFIHLATHGLLTPNNGDAPGAIVLAPNYPNQVNDGLLTPTEILDMKLRAELVVLSACDTAQGDVTSDGIVGLSRSFIAAGVPSVIVSLWAVPDAPTAELMQTFYQQLQHQPDKAQALRQAMLSTMKTHPQPRNWAAFTLIGETE